MVATRRLQTTALVAIVAALVIDGPAAAGDPEVRRDSGIVRIHISGRTGTVEGTAFLAHQSEHAQGVVQYFLTAGHLLSPASIGERQTSALRIRFITETGTVVEASGRDARFPGGVNAGLDLAVVPVASDRAHLTPVRLSLNAPNLGDTFLVQGYRRERLTTLTEQVRFRSTRLLIGDRTADDVSGLMGAPAMAAQRVFGLVTECSSTRAPVVTLLDAARSFLSRAIPGWPAAASQTRTDQGSRSERVSTLTSEDSCA